MTTDTKKTQHKKKPVKKGVKKKPVKKKVVKKPVKKKGKFISESSFSEAQLNKYVDAILKIRKNKKTKKQKKIGLTNTASYLNLMYNADKEMQRKPHMKSNLLMTNPFNYPQLIPNENVDRIWNATKMKKGKSKVALVSDFNSVYRQFYGFDLLKPPPKRLPKHKRGPVSLGRAEAERQPPQPPQQPPQRQPEPPRERSAAPSPPHQQKKQSDPMSLSVSVSESESSSDVEVTTSGSRNRKKKRR